ncbi:MAG: PmoA family protein, partial [Verrucomicrobiae bacterium]|nr:PmoA family protein [Verrucomicrobiae bacterium]
KQVGDKVRVEIGGELFTEYHYQDASKPFLYPVLGPGELPMTRNWPMEEAPGEDRDHPHHRSLWYAHGDVNGVDLWSEAANAGRTVHAEFLKLSSGPKEGVIQTLNRLESKEGKVLGTDVRTMTFSAPGDVKIIDFDITVKASHGDLVFGDTKEGTMALRLTETMRLKPNKENVGKPTGHIVNSEGVTDGATWGKRAKWVDYTGPVEGQTVGVAIFDHPGNPRHPTWWHVRYYGLFGANPFGIHDFERKPAGTGDYTIPSGESRTWHYRIVLHAGDTDAAGVAKLYDAYATGTR